MTKIAAVSDFDPIARELLAAYPNGAIVLLKGALGAGKTAFVKRFAIAIGADEAVSPTFGVMHEYAPNFRHFDLYRVGSGEFFARGLHETIEEGWAFIEWADEAIEKYLLDSGLHFVTIEITIENAKTKMRDLAINRESSSGASESLSEAKQRAEKSKNAVVGRKDELCSSAKSNMENAEAFARRGGESPNDEAIGRVASARPKGGIAEESEEAAERFQRNLFGRKDGLCPSAKSSKQSEQSSSAKRYISVKT